LDVLFIVSTYLFCKDAAFVDPTIAIFDIALEKRTLDVEGFLTSIIFAENFNSLYLFSNQFHLLIPQFRDWNIL